MLSGLANTASPLRGIEFLTALRMLQKAGWHPVPVRDRERCRGDDDGGLGQFPACAEQQDRVGHG